MPMKNILKQCALASIVATASLMAQTPYDEGQKALRDQRWQEAAEQFEMAIESDREQADSATYWRAYALFKAGRNSEAERELSRLERKYPDSRWTKEAQTLRIEPTHPVYFGGTQNAGLYTVIRGEERYVVAVNLADATESDIVPAQSLAFGRSTIEATQKPMQTTREVWPWFVVIALCVLQLEWWIYTKRAWI